MTQIWRINLKSDGKDPRNFCLKQSVLGVGWAVDHNGATCDWEKYYEAGMETYYKNKDRGWWPAVNAIRNRMQINDLCWTRKQNGVYYLGRITGEWKYEGDGEFWENDIVNVRSCDWKQIGTIDNVPGKVAACFRPARTVQQVHDESVMVFSQWIYNAMSNEFKFDIQPIKSPDIFALLSADDCEDLLGCYLQLVKDYFIIPSSCKIDTSAYEFALKHRASGIGAVAQVKNGDVNLDVDDYIGMTGDVYLFTTKGKYLGISNPRVHCIEPSALIDFMTTHLAILPDKIVGWIKILETINPGESQM